MRRLISMLCIGGLAVLLMTFNLPLQSASATTSWPVELSGLSGNPTLYANGEDILASASCSTTGGGVQEITDNGISQVAGFNDQLTCMTVGSDGTVYGFMYISNVINAVAIRDQRIKWATPLVSLEPCNGTTALGNLEELVLGGDGNVYLIAQAAPGSGCGPYLMGLLSSSGAVIKAFRLTPLNPDNVVQPAVWAYSQYLIVMDTNGDERFFSYGDDPNATTEEVASDYQFPNVRGSYVPLATADGRVILAERDCFYAPQALAFYHDLDGDSGSVNLALGGCNTDYFDVGPNDTLLGYSYANDAVWDYNLTQGITTSGVANLPPLPTGYSTANPVDRWTDASGDLLLVRSLHNQSTGYFGVSVDEVNHATGVITNLLRLDGDGTQGMAPWTGSGSVLNSGLLYVPVTTSVSGGLSDVTIYKFDVASSGFGSPTETGPTFTTSPRLQYVAMGDSYSSGEGNPGFIQGTNVSGGDQCHRSLAAYPYLLADDSQNGLNLVDNVACSGATTGDVLNGSNGEVPQVDALSGQTGVVTLTVGGNDVGFEAYATTCADDYAIAIAQQPGQGPSCGPGSTAYQTIVGTINASSFTQDLEDTYQQILDNAPNAQLYVVGYPYIASAGASLCQGFDLSGAYDVIQQLNSVIENAEIVVAADNAERGVSYIDPNVSDSAFSGHTLCDSDSYFNGANALNSVYSAHPNSEGQQAYATVIESALTDN